MKLNRREVDDFWAQVSIGSNDECWQWNGAKKEGYGLVSIRRRLRRAHRIAYSISKGPIPPGKQVMHTCDWRPCCNPNHLISGTNRDNVNDMVRKGRHLGGVNHWRGGLSRSQARRVCSMFLTKKMPIDAIARAFGKPVEVIKKIIETTTWERING